jgi:hypothetical protein
MIAVGGAHQFVIGPLLYTFSPLHMLKRALFFPVSFLCGHCDFNMCTTG